MPILALLQAGLTDADAGRGVTADGLGPVMQSLQVGDGGGGGSLSRQEEMRRGLPGSVVTPLDASRAKLTPMRAFEAGEVIAWRDPGAPAADDTNPWRYGIVRERVTGDGEAIHKLSVECGPGDSRWLMSSSVLSFPPTAVPQAAATAAPLAPVRSGRAPLPAAPVPAAVEGVVPAAAAPTLEPVEVASALRDMLVKMGLPPTPTEQSLLADALQLRRELAAKEQAAASLVSEIKKLNESLKKASGSMVCQICFTTDVDTVLVPCGHLCCAGCTRQILQHAGGGRGALCPFDRQRIERSCHFFKP